jgi:prepilin peptidase CpaA
VDQTCVVCAIADGDGGVGGVLTVVLAAWHVARRDKHKPSVPYGIAIALGGLWVIASGYLFPATGTVLAG